MIITAIRHKMNYYKDHVLHPTRDDIAVGAALLFASSLVLLVILSLPNLFWIG